MPLLLAAGRTPITEKGAFGSRSRQIHWGQEMFDQGGMVRELVKWDYEMRMPGQVADVVARAHEIAMSVAARAGLSGAAARAAVAPRFGRAPVIAPRPVAAAPYPDPAAIEELAGWIAQAERPLIVTAGPGTDTRAVAALGALAERAAIPVVSHNIRSLALPSSHPMHAGLRFRPADRRGRPDHRAGVRRAVVSGLAAAGTGLPRRPYRRGPGLRALSDALVPERSLDRRDAFHGAQRARRGADRPRRGEGRNAAHPADRAPQGRAAPRRPRRRSPRRRITAAHFSRAIGEAVGDDAIIFNEYPLSLDHCPREKPGTFYGVSAAGGLGWGVGAALGAKLAAPDRLIVATVGDGAYMFANPTVCHWVGDKFDLPVLTVIFNNSRYGAVRRATLSMFKDGAAGEDDGQFLADLSPSPPFEEFVRSQGGHGERVEKPEELAGALARARDAVMRDRKQALVNVICPD